MGRKEEILDYCRKQNKSLTAKEVLEALYPGKQQPYINGVITELVQEKKLIREESRPYTVRVPAQGEVIGNVVIPSKAKKARVDIISPCIEEVEKYLKLWDGLEHYILQERALNKLFFETYPKNTNIEDVLIKVASLNDFYSTQIFSVYPVAKNIVRLKIDERLANGDLSLVNEIASVTMEGGAQKYFYSFATKYCSHHQPAKFAIYDSYVETLLKYLRDVDGFSDFKDISLKDYNEFYRVLRELQRFYGLEQYTLKDIDRYLWMLGKEKFPKKY